ncbi:MAG: 50S ribosomal protein L29 [Anaerolineaceae bacterium]|jgi:large subunit ribosomal protein L29|nr:50S ribosomal protein L29 [Anaerolineaceae bacterium]MDD4043754.1 50S ribosomal protein L29 [Anaerolineaceae bacterium]MDD4578819.1 50S ribosomal protein L29 [Anaerolineaceae bacterium]
MNAKEVRELSTEEIKSKLINTRQELMNLRFQMVTGQLTDTSRFKVARRDIARLETVLNERVRNEKEGK